MIIRCVRCRSYAHEIEQAGVAGRLAGLLGMHLLECYICRRHYYVHTRIPAPLVRLAKKCIVRPFSVLFRLIARRPITDLPYEPSGESSEDRSKPA